MSDTLPSFHVAEVIFVALLVRIPLLFMSIFFWLAIKKLVGMVDVHSRNFMFSAVVRAYEIASRHLLRMTRLNTTRQ